MIDVARSFTSTLKLAKDIEVNCNNLELSSQARKKLEDIYLKFLEVLEQKVKQASLKIVLSSISKANFKDWYEYATKILRKLETSSTWLKRYYNYIHEHDLLMLQISIHIMGVFDALQCAFDKDYFSALASLVAACKDPHSKLPSPEVAETVCWTVHMAISTDSKHNPKYTPESWSGNILFKKLESCGLLVQFVRCSVSYPAEGVLGFGETVLKVYVSIIQHRAIVGMFQRGQPCGDTLISVLNGTDGHELKSKKVVGYLQTLSKMAEIVNDSINTRAFDEKGYRRTLCRNCNKAKDDPNFQKSLKACSRCKEAFYCSRECQTMDWKVHRRHCKPSPLSTEKISALPKEIITNFISRNGPEILAKLTIVCIETGTKPCDIIVLVDIAPGKDGSMAPALKEPPEFRIMPFHELPRENGTHKSDMCFSNEGIQQLKMHQSNRTSNQLLSVLNYPGGQLVSKYQAPLPSGYEMFGPEMVKGFIEFLYCGRFGGLAQIYLRHDEQIAIKHRLLLPMDHDIYALMRTIPNQRMASVAYIMANLKRFGATAKSTPKVGNAKEDVDRLFATVTSTRSA